MSEIEQRLQRSKDELTLFLCGSSRADMGYLEQISGGRITKSSNGECDDVAKALLMHTHELLSPVERPRKRRSAPKKVEPKKPAKKEKAATKGAEPAKRRGRPRGSKNKPKTEPAPTPAETTS